MAFADTKLTDDLILIEFKVNDGSKISSEILPLNEKLYLPIRQVASLLQTEVNFDRSTKIITFKDKVNSSPITINTIEKTITIGENQLDVSTNQFFWIEKSISITDEAMVAKELIETIFNAKIEYSEDDLLVKIEASYLKKAANNQGIKQNKEQDDTIRPDKKNFTLKALQTNYSAQTRLSQFTSLNNSTNNLSFGNFLNLNFLGEAEGGTYRSGPAFFFSDKEIGFAGMRQSWQKKIDDKFGLVLGDTSVQLNRLTSGGQIFGTRFGSPRSIGLSQDISITLQGACVMGSEVLLIINGQQISRQVCLENHYAFNYIPRLINPNNAYQIVQRNTDGSELTLREDRFTFYGELLPAKSKTWQGFLGSPPLEILNSSSSISLNNQDNNSDTNIVPNRLMTGGQFQYGLNQRLTLEGILMADRIIGGANFAEPIFRSEGYLPYFPNSAFLSGQTASIGLYARPKDNFGFRLNTGLSHSDDISRAKLFRGGFGNSVSLDYDWRLKNFSQIGNLFFLSPNYYASGGTTGNIAGANFSLTGSVGRQFMRASFQSNLFNLDKKSVGGIRTRSVASFSHTMRFSPLTSLQNTILYRTFKDDGSELGSLNYNNFLFHKITPRLVGTVGTRTFISNSIKPKQEQSLFSELSLGGFYLIGKTKRQQINFAAGFSNENDIRLYLQGRFNYKKMIYQPSINIVRSGNGSTGYTLGNGLFWQSKQGSRFGIEYTVSSITSPFYAFDSVGGIMINTTNRNINHSLALNLSNTLGFVDGKPHLLTSTEAGYLKAKAFIDLNKNGQQDGTEQIFNKAVLQFNGKEYKTDSKGIIIVSDIPVGNYTTSLDARSLPITLNNVRDFAKIAIESGQTTNVLFPLTINAGSITGKITIKSPDGKIKSAGNIVIIAIDKNGKEVSYTYTDNEGYYTLSELAPEEYIIKIDKADVKNRNLLLDKEEQKVNIPMQLEDFIEIKNINFEASQSLFGSY